MTKNSGADSTGFGSSGACTVKITKKNNMFIFMELVLWGTNCDMIIGFCETASLMSLLRLISKVTIISNSKMQESPTRS